MRTTHIKGLTLVNIGTGEKLGSVSEILFDPNADQVDGFAIEVGGRGGVLSTQPSVTNWIAATDVHAIGPDAMTVQDASRLRAEPGDAETLLLSSIIDEKVVTEGGAYVGKVVSVEIDETTMAVTGLELSEGFLKSNRVVAKADFVTIGDELVIVRDLVVAEPESTDKEVAEETPPVVTEVYGARSESVGEQ